MDPAEPELATGVRVNETLTIPRHELVFRATRSSGPGGQHVNKTSSRVELTWNVQTSGAVTDEQRARIMRSLASRLTEDGTLRVVASDTRSQLRNREIAERRLVDIVGRGLRVPRVRKATRRPRAADEARLEEKKRHSQKKRERQKGIPD